MHIESHSEISQYMKANFNVLDNLLVIIALLPNYESRHAIILFIINNTESVNR
jgi:hypothetical protein